MTTRFLTLQCYDCFSFHTKTKDLCFLWLVASKLEYKASYFIRPSKLSKSLEYCFVANVLNFVLSGLNVMN